MERITKIKQRNNLEQLPIDIELQATCF